MKTHLTIGYLYDNIMSVYGDRGNIMCLESRCRWRGIETTVKPLRVGDPVDSDEIDLFFIGGGADSQQLLIAEDLVNVKGAGIKRAIDEGAAAFLICAGYQLFGHYYKPILGDELKGLGLFDAWTIHHGAEMGVKKVHTLAEAVDMRSIGNLAVQWGDEILIGFESHGGNTYTGPDGQPFGRVIFGKGNNGQDGLEGCVYKNAIGTYLHGPCLPKNPRLADHVITLALQRRYGNIALEPLDDSLENDAHDYVFAHVQQIKPNKMMTTHKA